MFESPVLSPTSPVDSAMFPPMYNRSVSSSSSSSFTSSPDDMPVAPMRLLPRVKTLDVGSGSLIGSVKPELEPFEFRPSHPTPRLQNGSSLSSVFGDQDLIDAIMCSLTTELQATSTTQSALAPVTPRTLLPPTSLTTWLHHRPLPLTPSTTRILPGSCLRKPGTFLNKDGRWIKGKPCHMDGCDKRAQSNGLCKGHGGGARCSFTGCSKSSQGGGFCRAHGGGKRCLYDGCDKGTQRNGFCYLHGGVRSCSVDGCDKKDRGNGKCFAHGGGRKCQATTCVHTIRRGAFCDVHLGGHL